MRPFGAIVLLPCFCIRALATQPNSARPRLSDDQRRRCATALDLQECPCEMPFEVQQRPLPIRTQIFCTLMLAERSILIEAKPGVDQPDMTSAQHSDELPEGLKRLEELRSLRHACRQRSDEITQARKRLQASQPQSLDEIAQERKHLEELRSLMRASRHRLDEMAQIRKRLQASQPQLHEEMPAKNPNRLNGFHSQLPATLQRSDEIVQARERLQESQSQNWAVRENNMTPRLGLPGSAGYRRSGDMALDAKVVSLKYGRKRQMKLLLGPAR